MFITRALRSYPVTPGWIDLGCYAHRSEIRVQGPDPIFNLRATVHKYRVKIRPQGHLFWSDRSSPEVLKPSDTVRRIPGPLTV